MNELGSTFSQSTSAQAKLNQPAPAGWFALILASLSELQVMICRTDEQLARLGGRTGFVPPPPVGENCKAQAIEAPDTETFAIARKVAELRTYAETTFSRAAALNEAL